MTRVSLREAYDNKDVVAQIYAIRDTAESAEDTSEQAVTTANTASAHVDALVPQVEGAVQNANNASASAQASAQTVTGYNGRLTAVETGLGNAQGDITAIEGDVDQVESDLNAVTLRVQTAEGQIVTIQGRVTALETADGQNVKINRINDYAVGLTGKQNVSGLKIFENFFYIHARVQGQNALELARYDINTDLMFVFDIFSRFGSVSCVLTITTNGVDTITNMSIQKSVIMSSSILISALYAYVDNGKVVICFGNDSVANNYFAILARGCFASSGVDISPDCSATYQSRDVSNASKVVLLS